MGVTPIRIAVSEKMYDDACSRGVLSIKQIMDKLKHCFAVQTITVFYFRRSRHSGITTTGSLSL